MTQTSQTYATSLRPAPGIAKLIASGLSHGYAYLTAHLSNAMHPRTESPAEAAARLRTFAQLHSRTEPGFAADLYAAADRHEALYGD